MGKGKGRRGRGKGEGVCSSKNSLKYALPYAMRFKSASKRITSLEMLSLSTSPTKGLQLPEMF